MLLLRYYGRPNFQHIYDAIIAIPTEHKTKYFINSALGMVFLFVTRNGCISARLSSLVKAPVFGLRWALTFAFHGNPDQQAVIMDLHILDDLFILWRLLESMKYIS